MTDPCDYGKSRLWWRDHPERKMLKIHVQLRYKDIERIRLSQDDNAALVALMDSPKIADKLRALTMLFHLLEEQYPDAAVIPSEETCL